MSWFSRFLTSSLGRKLVMSLTGLFLISFLVVHLIGNFQLLIDDNGEQFNVYAEFMTTNPVIKTTSYLLYAFILLHAIQGILLWRHNRSSRGPVGYAGKAANGASWASRNMGPLGVIILVFILVHMYQFWLQMKLDAVPDVTIDGKEVKNLYAPVAEVFSNGGFVAFYVLSMVIISVHLWHGFQSAFQSLGLNHKKYTPVIRTIGHAYSVLVPLGFALIPIIFLINKNL